MSTREFNQLLLQNSEYLKPFAVTLTKDQESAKATSGGIKGDEIIVRFLEKVEDYLEEVNTKVLKNSKDIQS